MLKEHRSFAYEHYNNLCEGNKLIANIHIKTYCLLLVCIKMIKCKKKNHKFLKQKSNVH